MGLTPLPGARENDDIAGRPTMKQTHQSNLFLLVVVTKDNTIIIHLIPFLIALYTTCPCTFKRGSIENDCVAEYSADRWAQADSV